MESQAKVLSEQTVETIQKSNSLLEQLSGYKTYLYILLVVLVLSAIGYYLYIKNFKTKDIKKDVPTDVKTDVLSKDKKEILNPNTEYYIIDAQGNPILVNQYFGNIVQSAAQQRAVMINPKIAVEQRPQQRPQQRVQQRSEQRSEQKPEQKQEQKPEQKPEQRPKLSHPGEKKQTKMVEEDENVVNQDLTNTEIEELKKELQVMQQKRNSTVTAQNEDDGELQEF